MNKSTSPAIQIETSLEHTGGLALSGVVVAVIGILLEWPWHRWPHWGGYLVILGAALAISGLWGVIKRPTYLIVDSEGIHAVNAGRKTWRGTEPA